MSFSFKAITDYLAQWAPLNYAEDWDNAGLQVGDEKKEVRKLLLALTPSENIINQAVNGGYDAIITHHPLLFKSIKSVTPKTAEGRIDDYRIDRHDSLLESGCDFLRIV